jgi:hypothetical protein
MNESIIWDLTDPAHEPHQCLPSIDQDRPDPTSFDPRTWSLVERRVNTLNTRLSSSCRGSCASSCGATAASAAAASDRFLDRGLRRLAAAAGFPEAAGAAGAAGGAMGVSTSAGPSSCCSSWGCWVGGGRSRGSRSSSSSTAVGARSSRLRKCEARGCGSGRGCCWSSTICPVWW